MAMPWKYALHIDDTGIRHPDKSGFTEPDDQMGFQSNIELERKLRLLCLRSGHQNFSNRISEFNRNG